MTDEAAETGGEAQSDADVVADSVANDRPEWLQDRYMTDGRTVQDAVTEQAKGYNEIRGKLGAFTGAPDEYAFSLSEDLTSNGVELSADDPLIASFTELAKDANMSQEMAGKLVNMFVESQYADSLAGGEAETARQAEQMGLLGDNAQQRVSNIENWAKANLTPEQAEGLQDAATTAAGVQAIEALIAKSKNAPMQTADVNPASQVSMAELQELQFATDEHGNRKMQSDPEYRKMVQAKFAEAMPGENIVTVG